MAPTERSLRDSSLPIASTASTSIYQAPAIATPKGGGSIRGIGEKFDVNPVMGTSSFSIPLPISPGRAGFSPQLTLNYDSGAGNGPFGIGWMLTLPSITRKTSRGLPRYNDADESDVFILSGAEDLVPTSDNHPYPGTDFVIKSYRPRIEGLFARIERWTHTKTGHIHWRSITKDNVTTLYGRTLESCLHDQGRIFSWLICESHNDKGNAIYYEYKPENSVGVPVAASQESNRTPQMRATNRYIKRIHYGNGTPYQPDEDLTGRDDWLFTLVFDYGEHGDISGYDAPEAILLIEPIRELRPWVTRSDSFSTYRPGFEIRTYRRCQRVLMVHHFTNELGAADTAVRTLSFHYREDAVASFLEHVVQAGLVRQSDRSYFQQSMPPLRLSYGQVELDSTVHEIDPASLENLPLGLDNHRYQWIDLDGEGIPGILTEQNGGWYYKHNWSPLTSLTDPSVYFGPTELVQDIPSFKRFTAQMRFLDLSGDGHLDLVQFAPPTPGYFERNRIEGEDSWTAFKPFQSLLNIKWDASNVQFVDLTGDGLADVLMTEDNVFVWHPSLGESGFGEAERVYNPLFEDERGPRLVFSDRDQSIYLADMAGDGLIDLVRIRRGEVCYWPNLGYGHFGARVTMGNSPWFDHPDLFDQRRVRLADIDGSGVTDIIYLHSEGIQLYFNQSGNSWSNAQLLSVYPRIDNLAESQVVDLFGNGTACLVWSSPLPADANRPMRYIDLMGGQKPHLLIGTQNNLGSETYIQYTTSSRFYLQDQVEEHPWITRLPFPVHVVERVETFDLISHNRFTSRYAYHHGFFDGVEREFRGFGMVERYDTEIFESFDGGDISITNANGASHIPPVLARTWFHTGAFENQVGISRQMAHEYFGAAEELLLPDTILPDGLTTDELREACRALKGSILRQEVYALDGTSRQDIPYKISEHNYTVKLLQARGENRHAVFFVHARETLDENLERNTEDARLTHQMVLRVDDYGNVERTVSIAYPRRNATIQEQAETHITLGIIRIANLDDAAESYRVGVPVEERQYEMVYPPSTTSPPFPFDDISALVDDLVPAGQYESALENTVPCEYWDWRRTGHPSSGTRLRLLEHTRIFYRSNDFSQVLPLGIVESLAIPFEKHQLAFTPALLDLIYGDRVHEDMLTNAGYIHSDENWWIPSGHVYFTPDPEASHEQELAEAQAHFYLPRRFIDPLGADTVIGYDAYGLLLIETRDALGNTIHAEADYRTLQFTLITAPNSNRTAVAYDALGMIAGTAIMGKPDENLGDSLEGFQTDLSQQQKDAFFADPRNSVDLLQNATTRIIYDLHHYMREQQPVYAATLARQTHYYDLQDGETTKVQVSFSYSDGFAREIQKKIPAEPDTGEDRWLGTGWTIFNNKGNPVRQYEPFFSPTHQFEFAQITGVSPILFYDPIERVVATLFPDHSWSKVTFDPWQQTTWDTNDTLLIDPLLDPDVKDFFARLPEEDYRPTWYEQHQDDGTATKTIPHAATPSSALLDTLGRTVRTVQHNRFEQNGVWVDEHYTSHATLDIENNPREVFDPHNRLVLRSDFNLLGIRAHQASLEAGERWVLNDVRGNGVYTWDSRGHRFRTQYDALGRPVEVYRRLNDDPEILVSRTIYGESQDNPEAHNLRGQAYQVYDKAGIITTDDYDFKGNLLHSQRQLAAEYHHTLAWGVDVPLEKEIYHATTTYDALNRPVTLQTPDHSVIRPIYNEANLLERLYVRLRDSADETLFVEDIDYNAKGQRTHVIYSSGVITNYTYDPLTFRLMHLTTTRGDGKVLQNLVYTYDPVGNIMHIHDASQQDIFFRNQHITPDSDYTYDAIYRLMKAVGREHLGQHGIISPTDPTDSLRTGLLAPGDSHAMGRYTEYYQYDFVGNLLALIHRGSNPTHPGWTRRYTYQEASQLEAEFTSNRLSRTQVGSSEVESYAYDAHGNMVAMPHLPLMRWDCSNQLTATTQQIVSRGTPETTYYVYDAGGQRVRKITEHHAADSETPARKTERIYLGNFEIYREYEGNEITLERETLHIMDDKQRVALAETRTIGEDQEPAELIRFQHGNHLGSAVLELDTEAQIISYEEYYPFGSTSYQAVRSQTETPKRYRHTGKERDTENGLYYHGARYYAPWLGRWTSADPAGLVDGPNLYIYVGNNPIGRTDPTGQQQVSNDLDPKNPSNYVDYDSFAYGYQEAEQASFPESELRAIWDAAHAVRSTKPEPFVPQEGVHYDVGPRGEHFRRQGYEGPPRLEYTKPYAVDAAKAGNYEFAELAENYLCATCHVIAQHGGVPSDREFRIQTYVETYERNYKIGAILLGSAVATVAAPEVMLVIGSYEGGVSSVEAVTGETSGAHLSSLANTALTGQTDSGRSLSVGERAFEGFNAATTLLPFVRAAAGSARTTYVYQLVDEVGDPVYYGISKDYRLLRRLGEHGDNFGGNFRGMQVISEPLYQQEAKLLETALIRQNNPILNTAPSSINPPVDSLFIPRTVKPDRTLLNPALYPR